jgi:hypothetical protein
MTSGVRSRELSGALRMLGAGNDLKAGDMLKYSFYSLQCFGGWFGRTL